MSEVLEIEVDGELLDEGPSARAGPPKWGLPVAIALAGVLAIGVLVTVVVPALTHRPAATGEHTSQRETPGSPATAVQEAPGGDERLVAADAALGAWGRFAVTGDLGVLDGSFDVLGPQYRDLADEAAGIAGAPPGGPAYEVKLTSPRVVDVSSGEVVVAASVSWKRPGEADQRYDWEIVLRRSPAGRWLLWTVRPEPDGSR